MSLIYFNKYRSSDSSPIGFFNSFFEKSLLQEAKNIFLSKFPNPDDENDFWNKFSVDVDIENERFKVEYQIEEYIDEFQQPKTEVIVVDYTFESEIKKLFKYEYEQSKKLLLDKYKEITESAGINSNPKKIKNLKEGIKDIRYKIITHLENLNKEEYSDEIVDQLKDTLRCLILFLYNRFSSVLPDPKINKTVLSLIQTEKSVLEKFDLKVLSSDAADKFTNLKDEFGKQIIRIKDTPENIENFRLFCMGKITDIKLGVYVTGNHSALYYLISKISKKICVPNILIQQEKLFAFRLGYFSATQCRSESSKFPKTNKKWADLIDDTFRSCLI